MAVGKGNRRLTMNAPRCPLCGNEMQIRSDEVCSGYYMPLYYYECIGCPLATTPVDTAKDAENDIKDLISKFPPIMRVQVGNKLHFIDRSLKYQYYAVVTDVDVNDGWIRTDKGSCRPDDVLKWPWEIKQAE